MSTSADYSAGLPSGLTGERMTIRFLLLNAYTMGGTVRAVFNQAESLAQRGHDVKIISVWRNRKRPRLTPPSGVPIRSLINNTKSIPSWRRRINRLRARRSSGLVPPGETRYERFNRLTDRRVTGWLQHLDAGVLVSTRPGLNLLAARFAPPGVVVIGQEHSHYSRHKPDVAAQVGCHYRRLDALTVLNAADEAAYQRVLAGADVQIARIPNVLADEAPPPSHLETPLVMSAGRLVKAKGFQHLIRAFAAIATDNPQWQLRIFGKGPYRAELQDLIDSLQIGDRVTLAGHTKTLGAELARASIFALASQHEGFGMVLAEAMSHGVPVVSFDCPHGPAEIISNEHDGFLIPLNDNDGLAQAMSTLMGDTRLRQVMGRNAAASARRYHSAAIAPQWENLLRRFAPTRPPGRPKASVDPTRRKVGGMRGETPGRLPRRSPGELESEVLAALWTRQTPMTPTEVHALLGGDLAYNTIHTILKRLWDKGMVIRDAEGRRGAYLPAKDAAETTADAMHLVLSKAPNPLASLQHFVTGLDPAEEQALRDWLAKKGDS